METSNLKGRPAEEIVAFLQRLYGLMLQIDYMDMLFVRVDGEYAPFTCFVNCNDLFYWACADGEAVTPENIDELERAWEDIRPYYDKSVRALRKEPGESYPWISSSLAVLLFCARVRKMRPQGAYYDAFPPGIREMFDAAGPSREGDKYDTARREFVDGGGSSANVTDAPMWKCRQCGPGTYEEWNKS